MRVARAPGIRKGTKRQELSLVEAIHLPGIVQEETFSEFEIVEILVPRNSSEIENLQPFIDTPAAPSYGYHKVESIRQDSPYTQMVTLEKKVWDLVNLTPNGKPSPMWLYRIYPNHERNGELVKTRRQATEQYLAWHHESAPPPPPLSGEKEQVISGKNLPFSYKDVEWVD